MSNRITKLVGPVRLPPPEKSVLLVAADRANDEGRDIYLSPSTYALKTCFKVRTVKRALSNLRKRKILIDQKDPPATWYEIRPDRRTRCSRINLETIADLLRSDSLSPREHERGDRDDIHGVTYTARRGDTRSPETERETLKKETLEREGKTLAHELPADFKISDRTRDWLSAKPNVAASIDDLEEELEAFKDYYLARGEKRTNWETIFRNWLKKCPQFNGWATKRAHDGKKAEPKGFATIREYLARQDQCGASPVVSSLVDKFNVTPLRRKQINLDERKALLRTQAEMLKAGKS